MFSARTRWDFTPNALAAAREQAIARGDLIDLTASNPTTIGLEYPAAALLEALAAPQSAVYRPDPRGMRDAREAVAASYRANGVSVSADDLVLTASSSEAYSFLLKLLCDPGDSILVPQPSYPLFDDLAKVESARVVGYPLRSEDGWRADAQQLERAVDSGTRAIFAVSPNNPTGSFLVRDELDAMQEAAERHDLAIVVDEVFADYVWKDTPDRVRCAAQDARVLTFSLGGLSKSACLPQMKLGWIVVGGPAEAKRAALDRLEMIGDTFLSVGTPVQHAAAVMLEAAAPVRAQLAGRIRHNLAQLEQLVTGSSAASVLPVAAGWYAVLRLPRVMDGEAWSAMLAAQDGVLTHPGEFFGFAEEACLVLSLIAPEAQLARGVRRIAERVSSVVAGDEPCA